MAQMLGKRRQPAASASSGHPQVIRAIDYSMKFFNSVTTRPLFVLAFLGANMTPSFANELRILTSMPPSLTDPFVEGFQARYPGSDVLLLNKNTNAALSEIIRGNARGFDVFWASAPEAFTLLSDRNGFDAQGCDALEDSGYSPFAYSSIGWAIRRDHPEGVPAQWDDLLSSRYRGRIGMALPSRSGTSHMMIERFLQVRGWDEGWEYFLRLSENLATVSARSFGVVDGVRADRFDIGLSIDFLAEGDPELKFHYGQPIMVFPAQIGLLAGSGSSAGACDFIRFVISEEGQRLLLRPDIGRTPAHDKVRKSAPKLVPDALDAAIIRQWQGYNADLAQRRYWAVNSIFDLFIAELLPQRRELTARLDALGDKIDPAVVAELRRKLHAVPVSEPEAMIEDLNADPGHASDLVEMTPAQKAAYADWRARSRSQLAEIESDLAKLEGGLR